MTDPNEKADNAVKPINPNAPGVLKSLSKKLAEDIDQYAIKTYDDGHRSHLGGSLIGDECSRKLQFVFRWVKREKFGGRLLRLFQRGHREEHTFNEYLAGVGFEIYPFYDDKLIERLGLTDAPHVAASEPDSANKGARQFRIKGVHGHFGGSLDGIGFLPKSYGYDKPVLIEYKTNGTGAGFNKLKDKGMPIAKPLHYAQTNAYGFAYNLELAVYLNVNKNDDDLYIEFQPLKAKFGEQQFEKAERIIMTEAVLPPISQSMAQFPCSYCNFKEVCFMGEAPEKNCRSCCNATPVENGQWYCRKWNGIIPSKADILAGCPSWFPIING